MGWEDEKYNTGENLTATENQLIEDYRNLDKQGQGYILQTMDMVKKWSIKKEIPKNKTDKKQGNSTKWHVEKNITSYE